MVIETGTVTTRVDSEDGWRRSGLNVVDSSLDRQVVAFAEDRELQEFRARIAHYGRGPDAGQKSAYLESFFDSVVSIRPFGQTDRPGPRLTRLLESPEAPGSEVLVDVELWYPGDEEVAAKWLAEVAAGARGAGGTIVDTYVSTAAGIVLLRVRASIDAVREILRVDYVAEVELLPTAEPRWQSESYLSPADLGTIPVASDDSPVVGLIDSGVLVNHPLLSGSVIDATALASPGSGGLDEHGHGTEVASLLLHGSLDSSLVRGEWEPPICSVLSIRVLGPDLSLSEDALAERELEGAIRYLARTGVKVVNLSLGDGDSVYGGGRATRLAALLDSLARELGVVLVVPSGRIVPAAYYLPFDNDISTHYPSRLLDDADSGLLDPAPAALALTVGSVVPPLVAMPLHLEPLGKPGWPSPFSRRGPGIGGSVKPELVAPGGTLGKVRGEPALALDDSVGVRVADGRPGAAGLVTSDFGSSLAAPLVARAASAAEGSLPSASANLLRALTLQSAVPPSDPTFPADAGLTDGRRTKRARRLLGYGSPQAHRAGRSGPRDVVMYGEDSIAVNDVHLYAVPIPTAFFQRGAVDRGVIVSLAYDPPVRARRLDYVASRMQFELIRGLPPQQVLELFLADQTLDDDEDSGGGASTGAAYEKVSELPARHRIELTPSRTERSAGANQVGHHIWHRALGDPSGLGREFLLVIQNVNRWDREGAQQTYAVSVRFWVGEPLSEVYTEVRQRVDEVRARTRAQLRVRP